MRGAASLDSPLDVVRRRTMRVLANAIELPIRGLARVGFAPAAKLTDADRRSTAHLLLRGVLGTLWHRRRRSPSWATVSETWLRQVGDGPDSTLYGRFDPSDRLRLLTDNGEAFAVRARLYERARTRIDLSTYYLHDDETGRATARALVSAARRGVRVRVCADGYIMEKKEYEGRGSMRLVHELRAGGVDVRLWRDPERPYDTNHRKVLVVDSEALIIGGRNIADHYEAGDWRDIELLVEGPTAQSAADLFERTYAGATELRSLPGTVLQATTPAGIDSHAGFVFLLQCLRTAKRSVDIENAYYFSHPAVTQCIREACARGVRVRIFTNSAESNDLDYANFRLYTGFRDVLSSGAELWVRTGAGRTLHCKYFVTDGVWVSLGSSNLDYYSPRSCTEANVHVHDESLGASLGAWFEEGLRDAERIVDPIVIDRVLQRQGAARVVDTLLRDVQ